MTIRDLRGCLRRLQAVRNPKRAQETADDQALRENALAHLLYLAERGPPPAALPERLARRRAARDAAFTLADREALLARLRQLVATVEVRKGPLP